MAPPLRLIPLILLASLLAVPATGKMAGAAPTARGADLGEYEIKAGFLFNFAKFVEWPEAATFREELTLCIAGDDPFGPALESLVGVMVKGKTFTVRRTSASWSDCHILFISASEETRLRTVLDGVREAPVLTVGDGDGFAARGTVINFTIVHNKVRFAVNPEAARRAGLVISSKLLNLSTIVQSED